MAGRALGHVRQEAGPRLGPSQEFGITPPPRGPAPPPHSVSKSFRAASTTRGTCRSSSPRHQVAKGRETVPKIARDFPQHGALERARDGAQALLLAAPRARAPQKAGLDVLACASRLLTFASFTMMAAYAGGVCGERVAQTTQKNPSDVDVGRWYRRTRSAYA